MTRWHGLTKSKMLQGEIEHITQLLVRLNLWLVKILSDMDAKQIMFIFQGTKPLLRHYILLIIDYLHMEES